MTFWQHGVALSEKQESFVLVTLVSIRGSAPQDEGAKMIVTTHGLYSGTVGGGKIEMISIKKGLGILESKTQHQPEVVTWNLQKDIGMSCGGEVSLLFEHFFFENWPLVIFGAGHIAQALIPVLKPLKAQLTCIDSRQEWLDKVSGIKTILNPSPEKEVSTLPKNSFFMVMTMGHATDFPVLLEIYKHHSDCRYVGCIGSDVKAIKLKKQLTEAGVSESFIQKLNIPMGLTIGSNDPHEIAISIAAQVLQYRDT